MAISDKDIFDWFLSNPGADDATIAATMNQFSLSPEDIARATGTDLASVQSRYEAVAPPAPVYTPAAPTPVYEPDYSAQQFAPDVYETPVYTPPATNAYFQSNPDVAAAYAGNSYGMSADDFANFHYNNYGKNEGRYSPSGEPPPKAVVEQPPAVVEQPISTPSVVDEITAGPPTTDEEFLAIVGPPAVVEQPAQTPTNTAKYHDGTTYDATQLETLTKQITDLSSALGTDKFWKGDALNAGEGANIGFDANTAAQILGTDTVTNKQQVALDMAANLNNAGVTSLDQIGMGDIKGDVTAIRDVDANGDWVGTYSKLDTKTGQYVPADANDIRTVTTGDGESQQQTIVATGVTGTGLINKDTGQAIGDGSGTIGSTYTGDGATDYKLKIDPATGAPIFYTTGRSTNDLANLMEDLGPIGNIGLAIATGGLSIPQQIAANMALQALSGKDMDDVIKNAVVSFAGSQIPGMDFMKDGASFIKDLGLPKELTDTLTRGLQNAVTSTATAALSGKDDLGSAFVKGFTTGGTGAAVNALLGNIEGFGDLTADQKKMVVNAVTGVVSGKPLEQVVINSAISAANSAIAQAKGASTTPTDTTKSTTVGDFEDTEVTRLKGLGYTKEQIQEYFNRLDNLTDVLDTPPSTATDTATDTATAGTTSTDTGGDVVKDLTNAGLTQTDLSYLPTDDDFVPTIKKDEELVVTGDKPLDYLPTDDDFVPTKIDDKGEVVITGGRPTGTTSTDTTGLDEGPIIPTGGDGLETVTVTGGTGNDTITGGDGNDSVTGGTGNDTVPLSCPEGYEPNEAGTACIPVVVIQDKKCDPGYVYDEDLKQCVPIVTTPVVNPPVVVQPPVVKPPIKKVVPEIPAGYVPSTGGYTSAEETKPIYAGAMDDFDLFATLEELLKENPDKKKDNKKSKDKTKMATGGHLDDLLAEQITVDDLLKLLR